MMSETILCTFSHTACVIIYNMKHAGRLDLVFWSMPRCTKQRSLSQGFTIVEILIVIIVLAILGLIVILAYPGVQTRVRNTSMVAGVRQYVDAIAAYNAVYGHYPMPADGPNAPDSERAACLGESYLGGICLIEDVLDPPEVTNKSWLDNALKLQHPHLPDLPLNVKWKSNGSDLEAGALYAYTEGIDPGSGYDVLLSFYGIDSATAIVAYYLEGAVREQCQVPGSRSEDFRPSEGDFTDKDITICVVPLGDTVSL